MYRISITELSTCSFCKLYNLWSAKVVNAVYNTSWNGRSIGIFKYSIAESIEKIPKQGTYSCLAVLYMYTY